MTNRVGISIYCHCATKWLNLNNRGCLTHGRKNNGTSATKWLNYLQPCSAHIGAEVLCAISSTNWRITLSGRWKEIFQELEYFYISVT